MQSSRFGFRSSTRIALLAPLLLTLFWCFLMQPKPGALAAPLLGPWAGLLLGHVECSMATQRPAISVAVLVALVVVGASRLRARNEAARGALTLLLVLCVLSWCALALLSVVNTTV